MLSIIIILLLLTNLFTFLCLVHLEQQADDLQEQYNLLKGILDDYPLEELEE